MLFPNSAGGVPVVRTRPAAVIREVQWRPGDYETETAYIEERHGMDEHVWRSPATATGDEPVMLHYAVNRPVGAVRGESDLAPILPWLRRYSRWLEDRVRLNAAVRSFLWIVKAPERLHRQLAEKYTSPPTAGSVVISHPDEEWSAVAPTLHASDASHDGRAIRWMIVAGGPGTALLDLGEGEDSNLATGKAMAEQRRRFLRRRQAYITWMVADLLLHAYRMQEGLGTRKGRRQVTHADIVVDAPGHLAGRQPAAGPGRHATGRRAGRSGRAAGAGRGLSAHGAAALCQVPGRGVGAGGGGADIGRGAERIGGER